MRVVRPDYAPDPALSREEMEKLQHELAADAVFDDAFGFDPAAVGVAEPLDLDGCEEGAQTTLDGVDAPGGESDDALGSESDGAPVVVGVDQAFRDDRAVSAAVAIRDGRVVDCAAGEAPLDIPYVPGLLSFREGGAIIDALERLDADADLLVVDGSGRIHFREAGLATHVGVLFDAPAVGVAKSLLCGTPREPLDDPFPVGTRVAIEADGRVSAPAGTVVGYAFQSRQYPDPTKRHVNPLYVSPGHRVSAVTAVDLVERCCAGYKLPEPTRLADGYADRLRDA